MSAAALQAMTNTSAAQVATVLRAMNIAVGIGNKSQYD
jgi:hypothetical protein